MLAQSVLANNLANATSTGFKQDRIAFEQTLSQQLSAAGAQPAGSAPNLVTTLDPRPGSYNVTDRPLDFAIQGEGYFAVATPEGERYPRSGHFRLAEDGTLVTPQGFPVLSTGGPLTLPGEMDLRVTPSGEIMNGDQALGRLRLVTFSEETPPSFIHAGGGLLATQSEALEAPAARVLQGVLEGPNVEPLQALVEMITLLRHFEMNQKALQAQDQSLGTLLSWVRA
jgi:flagellar basal body rod protein FlgG